ncbi:MAG: cell wall hydrolase [Bacillota bacterium]
MIQISSKYIVSIFVMFLLFSFLLEVDLGAEQALIFGERSLQPGDEGADVAILQRKLDELGYYHGRVDGLYGANTESAVVKFQQDEGLAATGIFDSNSFAALPETGTISSIIQVSQDDIMLLARIIYAEARGESNKGKVAVGAVILNRVADNRFPNTLREVIVEEGQFSSLFDGQANLYPDEEAIAAAKAALLGYDPTYQSIFFYNPGIATNLAWISNRPVVKRIGGHVFAQ